jgi:hypothetical protein
MALLQKERQMRLNVRIQTLGFLCAGALVFCGSVGAQEKAASTVQRSRGYDLSREFSLQGTVVEYIPLSATPPLGAHVTLQTSSGIVDVHLGNPQTLVRNHLSLTPGDSVRIIGENINQLKGAQFVARIVQKGTQAIAVRSPKGLPLKPGSPATEGAKENSQQGRVL